MIRKETFEVISKKCGGRVDGTCYFTKNENVKCSSEICPYLDYANKDVVLTPEEFADKMLRIYKEEYLDKGDIEDVHFYMDAAIGELLISLGYEEAVYIFENTEKWYA